LSHLLDFLPAAPLLYGQLLVGLINGVFYAMLSLGLAIIFGLLNIVNFVHGALYMLGALCAYLLLDRLGIGFWPALILSPLIVGAFGVVLEQVFLRHLYRLDHQYSMLLTFGLVLMIEGLVRNAIGSTGLSYPVPGLLDGSWDLGFMYLPVYRLWAILGSITICVMTWLVIEYTRLGAHLRAATENPKLTRAFGVNVPRLVTLTYGFGVALAALAGVIAAPIYQVASQMGAETIIVVFAVVVIGGLGSIPGAIISGIAVGIAEGLTKAFYSQASTTVVFVLMTIVLLFRPAGLFGKTTPVTTGESHAASRPGVPLPKSVTLALVIGALALGIVAPYIFYPPFLLKILCFGLFACAFNLLIGYVGLLSFGHAAFYGGATYITAYLVKSWGFDPLLGVAFGTLGATCLGAVFAAVAIRRQGIYFSMVTLALAQMVYFFAVEAPFTHNDEGIQAVPRGKIFGLISIESSVAIYYFVFVMFLAGFWLIYRTVNSPFGGVLKAIRENEPRAISLGYDTTHYKIAAFTLSAAIAGLAGSLDALSFQMATLTNVHWTMSGHPILMTILGGLGTLTGPLVGAVIIAATENYLAQAGAWVNVIQGAIFVFCVMLFRRGVVGALAQLWARCARRAPANVPEAQKLPSPV
jgi:branched-chain amino acid transport system permease protein